MNANHRNTLVAIALLGLAQPAFADVIADWNDKAVDLRRQSQDAAAAGRADHRHDAGGHVRRRQLDRAQIPTLSRAASGGGNHLEGGRRGGGRGNGARRHRSAGTAQDGSRCSRPISPPFPTAPPSRRESSSAKRLRPRSWRRARTTAPTRRTPTGRAPRPASTCRPYATASAVAGRQAIRLDQRVAVPASRRRSHSRAREWAANYNEIKELGGRTSTKRSARQTEDARFWLAVDGRVYYPVIRTLAAEKELSLIDCARLFALTAVARADALIAVFDAKYHYEFWRPVTAIRNGDIDDNPATERDAAWQPIDATPMHPEYPCAHCIESASLAGVVQTVFGTAEIPEVSMTSPTAPGVIHHWTNVRAFTDEVSEARIWAGFHYRFSTKVGQDMGYKIGEYVVKNFMQPVAMATR